MLAFFCLDPVTALAQDSSRYYVRHFDTDNGLLQSSIKNMKMDSKGYLWLLTEAGLVRFDGQQFETYNNLPDGSKLTRRTPSLHLAGKDTVVISDEAQRYYRATALGCLVPYPTTSTINLERAHWLGNTTGIINDRCYLKVLDKEKPSWILPYFKLNNTQSGKGFNHIGNSYYWFNIRNELVSADTGLKQFSRILLKGFPALKDSAAQVRIVPHKKNLVIQWGEYLCIAGLPINGEIKADLVVHTGSTGVITCIVEPPLPNVFFVGTLTNGFYQFTQKDFTTKTFKGNSSNVFYALAPIGRHEVLTEKGIVTGNNTPQLDSFRAFTVLKTKAGPYVLSKWSHKLVNGLSFLDSTLCEIDFIPLPEPAVGYMYELSDGSICVSALGFHFGRLRNRRIEWYNTLPALKKFQVTGVQEIRPGLLWIGGHQGLAKFDINTHRFDIAKGLEGLIVRVLYLDRSGILWIGTYGNGFYACINNKIIKMPLDKDEYLRHVHAFMVDRNGFCWISTNRGLFQAKLSDMQAYARSISNDLYFHYYDKNSGFLTNEFNGGCSPSAIITGAGLFSFPSMNGIVQFDPLSIKPIVSGSGIYVDRVSADTQTFLSTSSKLTLPGGIQRLEFSVSSPFYGTPNNHQIEYRLNAFDSAWHSVPDNGLISFERLPGRQYELALRKRYGFDQQQTLTSVFFSIPPPFYETWWFWISMLALLLLSVWLLIGLRFRYLTQKQKHLETEVAFRTREQRRLIDELELSVADLEISQVELSRHTRLLEMLSMTISHDLQSPLRFFSEVSATLHAQAIELNNSRLEALSGELLNSSRNIHSFVRDFGYWIKSFENQFTIRSEPLGLQEFLDELCHFTSELLKRRGNQISIDMEEETVIQSDRQLLQIIVRNLIDNANKHTRNGHISLMVRTEGQFASIAVRDTGRGFSAAGLSRVEHVLRNPFNKVREMKAGSGYGYYFITDFCKLLDISIAIENSPEKGATITLHHLKVHALHSGKADQTGDYDKNTIS